MTPPYPGLPQVHGPPQGADYNRTLIKKGTRQLKDQEILSLPGRDLKLWELRKRQDALDVLDAWKREEDNDIIMEGVAMAESSSDWRKYPTLIYTRSQRFLQENSRTCCCSITSMLGQPKSTT